MLTSDRRILELYRLVDSGDFDLLSLDVFDTLVWRMVPSPQDVFHLVAGELEARGAMRASSSAESFVQERIAAEKRARRETATAEVTLDEIYDAFPKGYLSGGFSPRQAAGVEFEIERRIVRPDPEMAALLAHAKNRGLATALVSDSYFSETQIRHLAGVDVDHLLVSCEARLSKAQGLHRLLIEASGVAPSRILHAGDDRTADIEGPEAFGIARYWFRRLPPGFEDLVDSETPKTLSARAPFMAEDDAGLTALRRRMMWTAGSRHEAWGAGVLGPIVAGFCDWVAARCKETGVTHALCLMREGRLFKQALDAGTTGLETSELFASRYVAIKSSIFDASEEELRSFLVRPSPPKTGVIVKQLGLEPSDLPHADPAARLSPRDAADLARKIARDRALRKRVVESSAAMRSGLLAHLASRIRLDGSQKVAVVDLGYRATIQQCLQKIFDREDLGIKTHGLYLVTNCEVRSAQESCEAVEGWLAENGQPYAMAQSFLRSPEVIEQCLMPDCGTTVGYEPSGEPVLGESLLPVEQRKEIAGVQAGLMTFVRGWQAHKAAYGPARPESLERLCRAICIRSIVRPLPVEIELFGGWAHDENFGSRRTRTLTTAVDLDEWEMSHISAHQLASLPSSTVHWPCGLAHTMGPVMGEAVASIFLRAVQPEAFDSPGEMRRILLCWSDGKGFSRSDAVAAEYRLNSRGNVWHRFTLRMERARVQLFGVSIGLPGEIVRLTGVTLRSTAAGGATRKVRLSPSDIMTTGYVPLYGDLHLVQEDGGLFLIPAEDLEGFTGTLHLDLFFSVLAPSREAAREEAGDGAGFAYQGAAA